MQELQPRFVPLAAKTVVCHSVTYMLMGALAFHFLHYRRFHQQSKLWHAADDKSLVDSGSAATGVSWGAVRLGLYLFTDRLFGRKSKNGWLVMAWMLIGIGILDTFAAPPGSLEGFIYTTVPVAMQLRG